MKRKRPFLTLVVGVTLLLAGSSAWSDAVSYSKVVDLRAESAVVVAQHHHDWSQATRDARWKMISTTKDPFTVENTYAYLRLVDRASGRELFKKPVPALTHLWISPDSRYVVGLSSIKLNNPYQLVVFSRSGRRVLEKSITAATWSSVQESVTNAVIWYKDPPKIDFVEARGEVILAIEDRLGTLREFRFKSSD